MYLTRPNIMVNMFSRYKLPSGASLHSEICTLTPGDFQMTLLNSLFQHRSLMQAVLPNLYISSWYTIAGANTLETEGITHILSVMHGIASSDRLQPFQRMLIEINDDPDEDIIDYFAPAVQWIDDALAEGGKVVVHW